MNLQQINIKTILKDLGIIVGACVLIALFLSVFTGKSKLVIPPHILHDIDSLKAESAKLKKAQEKLDSLTVIYDDQIKDVETKIAAIKEKTTIIREYYHDRIIEADKYSKKEIEDFLKNRYK